MAPSPTGGATSTTIATLSAEAYAKVVLHVARHPSSAVSGLLLSQTGSSGAGSSTEEPKQFVIIDAVPLFHKWTTLSPMAEVAVQQVLVYCASNNLRIAGYYHANEVADDVSLPPTAAKMASGLREASPGPTIILLVDNKKLGSARTGCETAILPHVYKDDRWRPITENADVLKLDVDPKAAALAAKRLREQAHYNIIDFDDHLDDVRLNWLRQL